MQLSDNFDNKLPFFFRSIEELQEQNQKLLEIVRDLSEKKEADEKHATEIKWVVKLKIKFGNTKQNKNNN